MSSTTKVERKLAAIVFTDIVGFTEITANEQTHALDILKQQRKLLKHIVESYNGKWLKEIGDGLLFKVILRALFTIEFLISSSFF